LQSGVLPFIEITYVQTCYIQNLLLSTYLKKAFFKWQASRYVFICLRNIGKHHLKMSVLTSVLKKLKEAAEIP